MLSSQKSFYSRYSREVKLMTDRYIEINKHAKTIVRQATPEETEYYLKLLEGAKQYNCKRFKQ